MANSTNLVKLVSGLASVTQVLTNISFSLQTASNIILKAQQEGRDVSDKEVESQLLIFQSHLNDLKEAVKN